MVKRTYTDKDLREMLLVSADLAEELGHHGLADLLRSASQAPDNYEYEYSIRWMEEDQPDLSFLGVDEDPDDFIALMAIVERRREGEWEIIVSLGNIVFRRDQVTFIGRLYDTQFTPARDDRWLRNHLDEYQIEVSRELLAEARGR